MAILLGLLTTLLSIGIAIVISLYIGFSLSSLSVFFVIPVGGIAFGAFASLGFYYYLRKHKHKAVEFEHYFIGGILGLVAFIGIPFMEYQMTYVSENGDTNYQFEGDHISYFTLDNSPVTFSNYLSFTLDSGEMSWKHRGGNLRQGIETGRGVNTFKFVAEGVGFLIGSIFVVFLIPASGKIKCSACQKSYLKDIVLFVEGRPRDGELYKNTLTELVENDDFDKFTNLVIDRRSDSRYSSYKMGELKYGYNFYLSICNKCNQGYFVIKYFDMTEGGQGYKERETERRVVRVSDKFIEGSFKKLQLS